MRLIMLTVVLLISGCSYGIEQGKLYPNETFTTERSLESVYRVADAYPRECIKDAIVTGMIYHEDKTAIVRSRFPLYSDGDWLRVEMKSLSSRDTEVVVTVMDKGIYDREMIDAVSSSIRAARVVCR